MDIFIIIGFLWLCFLATQVGFAIIDIAKELRQLRLHKVIRYLNRQAMNLRIDMNKGNIRKIEVREDVEGRLKGNSIVYDE